VIGRKRGKREESPSRSRRFASCRRVSPRRNPPRKPTKTRIDRQARPTRCRRRSEMLCRIRNTDGLLAHVGLSTNACSWSARATPTGASECRVPSVGDPALLPQSPLAVVRLPRLAESGAGCPSTVTWKEPRLPLSARLPGGSCLQAVLRSSSRYGAPRFCPTPILGNSPDMTVQPLIG